MKKQATASSERRTRPAQDSRSIALRSLLMDRSSWRVINALMAEGIPSVLLKGPTTAQWLYEVGERGYLDLDILVRTEDAPAIDRVLHRLGYRNPRDGALPDELDDHSWTYQPMAPSADRRLLSEVDVHYTFAGVLAPAADVWNELQPHTVAFTLSGGSVSALDEVGRAVLIVLHAARDGRRKQQSFEDLKRLRGKLDGQQWRGVVALARELDALEAFAAGLMLLDDGPQRLAALGVSPPSQLQTFLYRRDVPVTSHRVEQMVHAPGVAAKAKLVARELWPTTVWLKWWAQEEGFAGDRLAMLRARRVANVVAGTPPAVAGWLRVRRAVRQTLPPA